MKSDGTDQTRLTNSPKLDEYPAWSVIDKIGYSKSLQSNTTAIYVIGADGSNTRRVTTGIRHSRSPSWSPDGTMLDFESSQFSPNAGHCEIYRMNADGSDVSRLTTSASSVNSGAPA